MEAGVSQTQTTLDAKRRNRLISWNPGWVVKMRDRHCLPGVRDFYGASILTKLLLGSEALRLGPAAREDIHPEVAMPYAKAFNVEEKENSSVVEKWTRQRPCADPAAESPAFAAEPAT